MEKQSSSRDEHLLDLLDYAEQALAANADDKLLKQYKKISFESAKFDLRSHAEAVKHLGQLKKNINKLLSRLPKGLMIAGSAVLASVVKSPEYIPNDIDIYRNTNDPRIVYQLDDVIKEVYGNDVLRVRIGHTLNWVIAEKEKRGGELTTYPVIQLVLPPVRQWSEVFGIYYNDMVCVGYVVDKCQIVYAQGRWDKFINSGVSRATNLFQGNHQTRKIQSGIYKYTERNFEVERLIVSDIARLDLNPLVKRNFYTKNEILTPNDLRSLPFQKRPNENEIESGFREVQSMSPLQGNNPYRTYKWYMEELYDKVDVKSMVVKLTNTVKAKRTKAFSLLSLVDKSIEKVFFNEEFDSYAQVFSIFIKCKSCGAFAFGSSACPSCKAAVEAPLEFEWKNFEPINSVKELSFAVTDEWPLRNSEEHSNKLATFFLEKGAKVNMYPIEQGNKVRSFDRVEVSNVLVYPILDKIKYFDQLGEVNPRRRYAYMLMTMKDMMRDVLRCMRKEQIYKTLKRRFVVYLVPKEKKDFPEKVIKYFSKLENFFLIMANDLENSKIYPLAVKVDYDECTHEGQKKIHERVYKTVMKKVPTVIETDAKDSVSDDSDDSDDK